MNQAFSLITTSAIAASAIFSNSSSFLTSSSTNVQPLYERVHIAEITSTPKIKENNLTWPQESQAFLPNISGFTEEEAATYKEVINNLFSPTGRNLFEL